MNKTVCPTEGCNEPREEDRTYCTDCRKQKTRDYYLKNKARISEQAKEYRAANPEKVAEAQRRWRENNEGHTYLETTSGYVNYIGYEHPATNASGVTNEHRIILWDKLEGANADCHWCDKPLFWWKIYPQHGDALVVDHLNNIKDDNRPENLVPACGHCNLNRPGNAPRGAVRTIFGKCEGPDCEQDARTNSPDKTMVLCSTHYNQALSGKELTKRRVFILAEVTETGRVCTKCDTFKPFEDYYRRTTGIPQSRCKTCMIELANKNKAERLALNIPCGVDGCDGAVDIKGLCTTHYHSQRAGGVK